jgi:putative addiction module killer protein
MKAKYNLEIYQENDKAIFFEWLEDLKDLVAQRKITARIRRATFGNFGDYKSIKGVKGLFEMREHYGCGYRIFYTIIQGKVILLLAGSSKKNQNKAITKAKEYLNRYLANN